MDATVRATCPKCRSVLRIPSQWVGQAVKCKKCGTVVRSKRKGAAHVPGTNGAAEVNATETVPHDHVPNGAGGHNAFDFSQPSPDDAFPFGNDPQPAGPEIDNRFDPTGAAGVPSQPAPPPVPGVPPGYPYPLPTGYPYPVPPGYPQPGAAGAPPGYPYAPPPGYPYPVPPGYPPYNYPVPPGYPPLGAYGVPPGYPYPAAPGTPGALPPGAQIPAPAAPLPGAPGPQVAPPGTAVPHAAALTYPPPQPPAAGPAMPAHPAKLPAPAAPAPVPPSNEFKTDAPAPTAARRYRRPSNRSKMIWVGVCLLLTGGLVTAAILGASYVNQKFGKDKKDTAERGDAPKADPKGGDPTAPAPAKAAAFPRRMLFIHISKYMFLNPLTAARPGSGDRTKGAAVRLANEWQVPYDPKDNERSQLFVLSDTARPDNPKADIPPPMRNVVMGAYEQFFATSRGQDRVVVYFGGHALVKDGKAYLAPVEGDLDDPEPTLIPLSDFYDKLKACKASQKVVIWDVCRFNPDRPPVRPGSEPMSEELHKALVAAPPGVEVMTTCQPGENALEFNNFDPNPNPTERSKDAYEGSAFLEALKEVAAKHKRVTGKPPAQSDPIPVADWSAAVGKVVGDVASKSTVFVDPAAEGAKESMPKDAKPKTRKQTVRLDGKPPASPVPFNPEEGLAKRFEFPPPPAGISASEIANIVNEFATPPIIPGVVDTPVSGLPYREEVMKDYKTDLTLDAVLKDRERYKFQVTTFEAIEKIRKMWTVVPGATGGPQLREEFIAPVDDKLKKSIKDEQDFWAIGVAELDDMVNQLDALAPMRDTQPKRWQAHYDYARAVTKARLAFMNEYNKVLGDVLTETLAPLDPKLKHDRYKIVFAEKMKSNRAVQAIAAEAKEAYEKLIAEHKGTPWAIQAKRDKAFALGLAWQPAPPPGESRPVE